MEKHEEMKKKEKDIAKYIATYLKKHDDSFLLEEIQVINSDIIINNTDIKRLEKSNNLSQFINITNDSIGCICVLSKFFYQLCELINGTLSEFEEFEIEKSNCKEKLISLQYFCEDLMKNYDNLDFLIKSIVEKVVNAINLIDMYKTQR